MTKQEFRHKIKGYYKTDNVVNYAICTAFILLGLYFLIKFLQRGFYQNGVPDNPLSLIAAAIPLSCGIYGLWRVNQDYVVGEVHSSSSIDSKKIIIESYLAEMKILFQTKEGNYYSYRYRSKYFMIFDLKVYLTDDTILYNIVGVDRSPLKGIIDFGLSYRAARKFQRHLEAYI